MASSSSEKNLGKQQAKPSAAPPQHMKLPREGIEKMKELQNWPEKYYFTYDEEKIRRVWEIQQNMDINDLLSYVMYGDGEEVVWDDDVWNVQSITQAPEYRETKRLKTAPKENMAGPSLLQAVETPLDNGNEKPLDNGNEKPLDSGNLNGV